MLCYVTAMMRVTQKQKKAKSDGCEKQRDKKRM
jgi:hypothetical protein